MRTVINFIRALLFNVVFYGGTAVLCFAYIPTLVLPRPVFMVFIRFYFHWVAWAEKYVLGLKYEVRGWENVPKNGAFLIAAKHQSAYETMKFHVLFKDPAIILKRELLRIPLWGWMAAKARMIAIDRTDGKSALQTILENAKPVVESGRPIVIFPQGTRVPVGAYKPYKFGITRMYEHFDIPILPMAINAGVYWKKKAFIKRPGTVVFEFLPPIMPGQDPKKVLATLEKDIESHSDALVAQARQTLKIEKK